MTEITLAVSNGNITTTSNAVADVFGKLHKNVIRAIDNLDCSDEFRRLNFEPTPYVDQQNGETYRAFTITKDGFVFLAMGFRGKEAAQWKEKYIAAFNAMEAELGKVGAGTTALPNPNISTEQQNALQVLVRGVVETTGKPFGEIWSRLHNKFHIPRYQELPAAKFDDAVAYLKSKLVENEDEYLKLLGRMVLGGAIATTAKIHALPARRAIRCREDLSFTMRDAGGRMINWHLEHSSDEDWGEHYTVGQGYMDREIAELAAYSEEDAYCAIKYAISGSHEFRRGESTHFGNTGWGAECGFAEAIARAVIDGLRARRSGVASFQDPDIKRLPQKVGAGGTAAA